MDTVFASQTERCLLMFRSKLFAILAASTGRANIVRLLPDHGADISGKDYYGRTPLDRAEKAGHIDVEEVLLKHRPL